MCIRDRQRQNKFTDVSNDAWYCSAVSTLSAMGIISGYPDATFRPTASITRADFAALATRFDVNGDKTPASFNDIAGHWAKDEIAVAANNGCLVYTSVENGPAKLSDKLSAAPKGTANENYSPEGKWYKKVNDDLVSVDNILNVNIDSDTTFVLKFDKQQYTIEYQWSTDRPSDITETQLPPATTKDGLAPTEETEINALNKAAEKTYTTTSTTNKDGKYGEWTLVGWTPLRSDDGTKIIFTGNWLSLIHI